MNKFNRLKILKGFRQYSVLLLLGLVLFFVFNLPILKPVFGFAQNLTTPLQTVFYSGTQGLADTVATFAEIGSLRKNNSDLRTENALLLADNAVLKKLEAENKSLKEQINTPDQGLTIKASASPIGFSGLGSESILLIDKGASSKVQKGDFVIIKNILIGKVVEASSHRSSVQLLTDPNSKIPVKTEDGSEGILEGQFGSNLMLTNVSQDQKLTEGQLLLTSGKNEYPIDLVVGRIKKVNRIEKEFFQKAEIEQLLQIGDLSLVYIVAGE